MLNSSPRLLRHPLETTPNDLSVTSGSTYGNESTKSVTQSKKGSTPPGLSDSTGLRSLLNLDEGVSGSEPVLKLAILFILCSLLYLRSFGYKRVRVC